MAALFSKPKMPEVRAPDPLPPPPERSSDETVALAEAQRAELAKRRGRAATMLTGGSGASGGSAAISFLGGAART